MARCILCKKKENLFSSITLLLNHVLSCGIDYNRHHVSLVVVHKGRLMHKVFFRELRLWNGAVVNLSLLCVKTPSLFQIARSTCTLTDTSKPRDFFVSSNTDLGPGRQIFPTARLSVNLLRVCGRSTFTCSQTLLLFAQTQPAGRLFSAIVFFWNSRFVKTRLFHSASGPS